ncbi:putative MFS family arabinose efflux permease [Azomonas macrocytogenes]|uniref:Putative MFS family arabinose efflux permease n=1 Tax=Azomonas macrocytogenes TaxID=69962 RepID=A0A839T347_AZOMA|nr:putative MFS family arabinose efflux permease [Azomonas macrocytogenes]
MDTLLYLLLPLYAAQFGVTIAEAGVLLAANRLVRIAGYGWVARFYARQGDRLTCTLAVAVAAICAIGHATLSNFWMLLPLRLLWGLSYAALNLSTQVLATAELDGAARRTGRSRAIIAMGPALALPIGAVLAEAFGPRSIFVLLAGISLIALVVTRELPSAPHPVPQQARGFRIPNSLDTWSFLEGLTLDGLFIIGLSYLGRDSLPGGAVVAVGLLLAMRYLGEMLLSPAGGRLAELFGPEKVLVTLSLLTSIALIGFGAGWLWGCAASIVILRSLQLPLMAPIVARRTSGPGRVQALASRATWRDIGAGAGPILAGALLPVVSPVLIYSVSALLLACAALACVSPFVNPDRNSISP